MKVLFIVQGEGRGHLTQAITMEEMLRRNGHEVVEVLVGKSGSRQLPKFFSDSINAPVKRFMSPNFLPTPANKRNRLMRSVVYNVVKAPTYLRSIWFIRNEIARSGADLVVNFYEMLTGITYLLFSPDVPQVSIGHQYLFLHRDFKFPDCNRFELASLRLFTRITSLGARDRLALSFHEMPDDRENNVSVVPPLLRKELHRLTPTHGDYLHGYMVNSGFGESIRRWHEQNPMVKLNFFWDKKGADEVTKVDDTLTFNQIDDHKFLQSMAGCWAYATTAGFESVCEAMYLGKPIMMVPAHIEQDCNAFDASQCGAGVVSDDFDLGKLVEFAAKYKPNEAFKPWADSSENKIVSRLEKAAGGISFYPMPEYAYIRWRYLKSLLRHAF